MVQSDGSCLSIDGYAKKGSVVQFRKTSEKTSLPELLVL